MIYFQYMMNNDYKKKFDSDIEIILKYEPKSKY